LQRLEASPSDLVIVHLSGTAAIGLFAPQPDVAILVVTGLMSESLAVRVLRPAVQGTLPRSTFGVETVIRSLHLGIERRRIARPPDEEAGLVRVVPVPEHLHLAGRSVYALGEQDT